MTGDHPYFLNFHLARVLCETQGIRLLDDNLISHKDIQLSAQLI